MNQEITATIQALSQMSLGPHDRYVLSALSQLPEYRARMAFLKKNPDPAPSDWMHLHTDVVFKDLSFDHITAEVLDLDQWPNAGKCQKKKARRMAALFGPATFWSVDTQGHSHYIWQLTQREFNTATRYVTFRPNA